MAKTLIGTKTAPEGAAALPERRRKEGAHARVWRELGATSRFAADPSQFAAGARAQPGAARPYPAHLGGASGTAPGTPPGRAPRGARASGRRWLPGTPRGETGG